MFIKQTVTTKHEDVTLIPCDYFLGIEDIMIPLIEKIKTKDITVRKNKNSVIIYDDENTAIAEYKTKKHCIRIYTGHNKEMGLKYLLKG